MSSRRRDIPAYGGRYKRGNKMGYGGIMIKTWEVCSHSAFILGAACYAVNGVYWAYFDYRYTEFKIQTTTTPSAFNISNMTNATTPDSVYTYQYYNYNYYKAVEINKSAIYWEIAGAIFYMLNPLFEFGTGSLKKFCGDYCCNQPTRVETFVSLPWMPLAAVLFLIGSIFYTINVFVPLLNLDGYDSEVYEIVDLCAAITFILDAFAYLIARLSMKWRERGTSDETSILCCHSNYRGFKHCDFGFYGDLCFITGAGVEMHNHFNYSSTLNLVACVLWGTDAALYLLEWILIHKLYAGRPDPIIEEEAQMNKYHMDPSSLSYTTFDINDAGEEVELAESLIASPDGDLLRSTGSDVAL